MKYYIPTSSLNLDHILQSESIAPTPFYSAQAYGQHSFEVIPPLRDTNALILFDHPVSFTLRDRSRLNYPILIEIHDPSQLSDAGLMPLGNGVFTFNTILRLTPSNCRIFFFSKKAYDVTLVGLRDNKRIKFFNHFSIIPSARSLKLVPMPKIEPVNIPLIYTDEERANRIKGAAFAYFLGQTIKSTPELAHFKKLSQDIYDQTTGIIANFRYADNLKKPLLSLLKEFKAIDPTEKASRSIFDSRLTSDAAIFGLDKKQFIAMNEKWESWGIIYDFLAKKWNLNLLPLASSLNTPDDYLSLRNEIRHRTTSTVAEFYRASLPPQLSSFAVTDQGLSIRDMPVTSAIANFIIKRHVTVDSLMSDRDTFISEMESLARGILPPSVTPGEWDRIYVPYFLALRSHIHDITRPFDVMSVPHAEIRSLAVFILRFNNIGDLLSYMLIKEIPNPTGVLTLWGALNGYINLNRDVLSPILTSEAYTRLYTCLYSSSNVCPSHRTVSDYEQ